jgi:hypothetical protein
VGLSDGFRFARSGLELPHARVKANGQRTAHQS